MKTFCRTLGLALGVALALGLPAARVAAAPPLDGKTIIVTRVSGPPNGPPTSGTTWDVTLPPGRFTDQAWLVVDGHSQGLAGYDVDPNDHHKPARFLVNINNDLDGQVKDILKAQGLPVKRGVTVYRVTYAVNVPSEYSEPLVLHFRHEAVGIDFNNTYFPEIARYKIGNRITLFDAVMWDSKADFMKTFDLKDPRHRPRPGLPVDLVHHVMVQVQFLRVRPDDKVIQQPAAP